MRTVCVDRIFFQGFPAFQQTWLIFAGAFVLALQPLHWLFTTWRDPAYASDGWLTAALTAFLFAWSLGSPLQEKHAPAPRRAFVLLGASALLRLGGQVLGINVLGALTLVVDIYALALLGRVGQRRRALSPFYLALLFAFSLPLERIVQRLGGYLLQEFSAAGACALLQAAPDPVTCEGTRIILAGRDVLVDLPCSGAGGLLLLLISFSAGASLLRPSLSQAAWGLLLTLSAALFGNMLRISLLALGLAYSENFGGVDVMQEPWHALIGYISLALAAVPVFFWGRAMLRRKNTTNPPEPRACRPLSVGNGIFSGKTPALLFVIGALLIVSLPARPLDVARAVPAPRMPVYLGDLPAHSVALDAKEQVYFERYGGGAAKALYGPYSLLLVRTTSPLRHLHAPDECLRGSGHTVSYIGTDYRHAPTAVYRSVDPAGRVWRVQVNFISTQGVKTANVSEAVWHWLQQTDTEWLMLQRVSPWRGGTDFSAWNEAVRRAFELGEG